jgi:hypothetical protein
MKTSWAPVAYACNSSYSGGGDEEDHGWKPAQAISSQDSKNPITKKMGWWSGSRCRPSTANPSTAKRKKKKQELGIWLKW